MTAHRYRAFGRDIASDRALPGLRDVADDAPATLTVRWEDETADALRVAPVGDTVAETPGPAQPSRVVACEQGLVAWYPGLGSITVDSTARSMVVRSSPDGGAVMPWLALGVGGALIAMDDGRVPLHATTVVVDEAAMALVAGSGYGKSTAALLLASHGARLLAEDLSAADVDGERAVVEPGLGVVRSRRPDIEIRALFPDLAPVRSSDGRALVAPETIDRAVPLEQIVHVVLDRNISTPVIASLGPLDLWSVLAGAHRLPGLVPGAEHDRFLDQIGVLAERVTGRRLHIPWSEGMTRRLANDVHAALTADPGRSLA